MECEYCGRNTGREQEGVTVKQIEAYSENVQQNTLGWFDLTPAPSIG